MNHYLNVFRKYADFDGRARRAEYWYFVLFNSLVSFFLFFLGSQLNQQTGEWLYTIYFFAGIIPTLAVTIRRLHDVGKSGWNCLIPIYALLLLLAPGDHGPNAYGPDPKDDSGGFQDPTLLDN